MKKLFVLIFVFCSLNSFSQIWADTIDFSKMEMRCGVAHWTKDGIFSCDFNSTYYPAELRDSTIRKWFIKIVNGDSLFYYRTDVIDLYIWNRKSKKGSYGYECKEEGGSTTIYDLYNGSDTIKRQRQIWKPKP